MKSHVQFYLNKQVTLSLLKLITLRDGLKSLWKPSSILDRKRSGRPDIDKENVNAVRVAFHRSPRKSIRVAICNLQAWSRSRLCKTL